MKQAFIYCPRCGAPLAEKMAFGRPRPACRHCGFIYFHDPKVGVAVLVYEGERVLLVKRSAFPRIGYWALPAGYMDYDELPEQTAVREIQEETGLIVELGALKSVVPLSGWEEPRGILLVYTATPVSGELLAADDVSEVAWFTAGELPWDEIAFESTADLLRAWAASLSSGF